MTRSSFSDFTELDGDEEANLPPRARARRDARHPRLAGSPTTRWARPSLESALGLGVYSDEPTNELRLFGVATVNRDRGLALVYGAALAGWCYLVAWGSLRAADAGHSRPIGAAIGAAVGVVVLAELTRVGTETRT
jgi:hypothetical protein